MSEMIERVAKAMCRYRAKNPVDGMSGTPRYEDGPLLDTYIQINWAWWESDARAAIEAMREPTECMVAAARRSAPYDRDAGEVWPLMIDEALR